MKTIMDSHRWVRRCTRRHPEKIVRELLTDEKTKELEANGEVDFHSLFVALAVLGECLPPAGRHLWFCVASIPMCRASMD